MIRLIRIEVEKNIPGSPFSRADIPDRSFYRHSREGVNPVPGDIPRSSPFIQMN
jgi:hypothetical protein